jgi:CHASE2 domain-containing sensor protein
MLRNRLIQVLITILSAIVLSYCISFISNKVNFLERFTIAINDIDFSDLYYQSRKAPAKDTNIVIVNIGNRGRAELAGMLKTISDNNPRVIGIDVFFNDDPDKHRDSLPETKLLSATFQSIHNAVLASAYRGTDDKGRDLIEEQSPVIKRYVIQSLVNLNIAVDDPNQGTVRSFDPVTNVNGVDILSFGFSVASFWDKSLLAFAKGGDMFVNWYGYVNRDDAPDSLRIFTAFNWDQIEQGLFKRSAIENKIVILGFLGENISDCSLEDKFYSPLNDKMIGRSLPDMWGVEVHANIIKMIIDRGFISHSKTRDFLVNYGMITVLVFLLIWIYGRYERQYSIVSKIAVIVFLDVLAFAAIGLFMVTHGEAKILVGDGLFVMVFIPDTYEFLQSNLFNRKRKEMTEVRHGK